MCRGAPIECTTLCSVGPARARGQEAVTGERHFFPSRYRFLIFANLVHGKCSAIPVLTFSACLRWRPATFSCPSAMHICLSKQVVTSMLMIQHDDHATVLDSYAEPVATVPPRVPGCKFELSRSVLPQATMSVMKGRERNPSFRIFPSQNCLEVFPRVGRWL